MNELLVFYTGLFNEADQIEQATALCHPDSIKRIIIDVESMDEQDWDNVLVDVLSSKAVITV